MSAGSMQASDAGVRGAFALGWLMAELFDPGRREGQLAFSSPDAQLPLVSGLDAAEWRTVALSELEGLLAPYQGIVDLTPVKAVAYAGKASPFNTTQFTDELRKVHEGILLGLAGFPGHRNGYELGITLSDLCFLPAQGGPGDQLIVVFGSANLATMHERLRRANNDFPGLAAASVSVSIRQWQSWVNVFAGDIPDPGVRESIISALRVQASLWHSLLTGDAPLGGESPSRTEIMAVIQRFVPAILAVGVVAVTLYITLGHFSLTTRVLSIAGSLAVAIGITGASVLSGARKVADNIAWEVRSAAKVDTRVGTITWLPTVRLSAGQRRRLVREGVTVPPRFKRNLDARAPAPLAAPLSAPAVPSAPAS
jgi:hypothetical protein